MFIWQSTLSLLVFYDFLTATRSHFLQSLAVPLTIWRWDPFIWVIQLGAGQKNKCIRPNVDKGKNQKHLVNSTDDDHTLLFFLPNDSSGLWMIVCLLPNPLLNCKPNSVRNSESQKIFVEDKVLQKGICSHIEKPFSSLGDTSVKEGPKKASHLSGLWSRMFQSSEGGWIHFSCLEALQFIFYYSSTDHIIHSPFFM